MRLGGCKIGGDDTVMVDDMASAQAQKKVSGAPGSVIARQYFGWDEGGSENLCHPASIAESHDVLDKKTMFRARQIWPESNSLLRASNFAAAALPNPTTIITKASVKKQELEKKNKEEEEELKAIEEKAQSEAELLEAQKKVSGAPSSVIARQYFGWDEGESENLCHPASIAESHDVLDKETMFRARQTLARIKLSPQRKQFCSSSSTTKPNNNNNKSISGKTGSKASKYEEAYRQLDDLDFMKKKKKFGIDFHLVQLFFTCLPAMGQRAFNVINICTWLIRFDTFPAQWTTIIDIVEQLIELEKKNKEEEEELKAIEEKAQSEAELLEVHEDSSETVKHKSLEPASIPDSSQQDQKGEIRNEGTSPDAKR
ncbi:hypothetical protein SADUNF_Sadunf03G0139400 [Salix dunnii]|uniref:Uncharacterized protein n=1 Tax=Salix dunnii TaxID=1413687 RepID=A0A835TE81_9ROSI|nr:hypothetical protein SADUNF_Sadunf03G0139400 [Salix dunnii]